CSRLVCEKAVGAIKRKTAIVPGTIPLRLRTTCAMPEWIRIAMPIITRLQQNKNEIAPRCGCVIVWLPIESIDRQKGQTARTRFHRGCGTQVRTGHEYPR